MNVYTLADYVRYVCAHRAANLSCLFVRPGTLICLFLLGVSFAYMYIILYADTYV